MITNSSQVFFNQPFKSNLLIMNMIIILAESSKPIFVGSMKWTCYHPCFEIIIHFVLETFVILIALYHQMIFNCLLWRPRICLISILFVTEIKDINIVIFCIIFGE